MSAFPHIRQAEKSDALAIAEIYTESILARDCTMDTGPFSEEHVVRLLDSTGKRERILVIETSEGVRGWGIAKKYSDRSGYAVACETSVYLFRSSLRQGLGRLLQMELHRFAKSVGYHHIVTKIWADNLSSMAFHEVCGFTLVGIQSEVGRVDDQWRDVAIMQYLLED